MSTKNKAFVLWLTGLSGSGKSTIADKVYDHITVDGRKVEKLDGDVMRGFLPSTGFTKQARDEHVKRVGFMACKEGFPGARSISSGSYRYGLQDPGDEEYRLRGMVSFRAAEESPGLPRLL